MLSILIPVYNVDIRPLVNELNNQAIKLGIEFEILCLDDASDSSFSNRNRVLEELPNIKYMISRENMGRAISKKLLSSKAKYDWLLLIDSDTFPKSSSFLKSYIPHLKKENTIVFGGFAYETEKPKNEQLLRWLYGTRYEQVSAKKRNKNPYKVVIAANLLVKKEIYEHFKLDEIGENYGMDLLLGAKLKQSKAKVCHIDNEVFHLGLENSTRYLEKTKMAIQTCLELDEQGKMTEHSNSLLMLFKRIKHINLHYAFAFIFRHYSSKLSANITGKRPSTLIFQFYKICFMCHMYLKEYSH